MGPSAASSPSASRLERMNDDCVVYRSYSLDPSSDVSSLGMAYWIRSNKHHMLLAYWIRSKVKYCKFIGMPLVVEVNNGFS